MDPFDFDLPSDWGYYVPEPLPLTSTFDHDCDVVEEWFRVPHTKLLEVTQRKSGGIPSATQPSKAAVAAAVMKEVREGAHCASKGRMRAGSSPARGKGGGSRQPTTKPEPENDPIQAMLAAHNKKFKKTTYEPRQHSVKDVKQVTLPAKLVEDIAIGLWRRERDHAGAFAQWEEASGKKYYDLSPSSREAANQEISAAKTRK